MPARHRMECALWSIVFKANGVGSESPGVPLAQQKQSNGDVLAPAKGLLANARGQTTNTDQRIGPIQGASRSRYPRRLNRHRAKQSPFYQ
jgi:hypothetical protein